MCGSKQNPWLFGLGMLLAVLVVYGGRAQADITSDRAGSVIIFPKVISDGTRDTIIQIANTQNSTAQARCFYIDSTCLERDFEIFLTKQQPTVWLASLGRPTPDTEGFWPGGVLPVIQPFAGQLICIQVDGGDAPAPGNALKGEAIIFGAGVGEVSEYNAISVLAGSAGSNILDFNRTASAGQYNPCPAHLVMNHYAEGTVDAFTGGVASTELTLIPCTALIEEQLPVPAVAQFQIVDEMEFSLSASVAFSCFLNINLGTYFGSPSPFTSSAGHTVLKTRITPATGSICYTGPAAGVGCSTNADCPAAAGVCTNDVTIRCSVDADCGTPGPGVACRILGCNPYPGLLGVAEEFQTRTVTAVTGPSGSAAVNLFTEGSRPGDFIVLAPAN